MEHQSSWKSGLEKLCTGSCLCKYCVHKTSWMYTKKLAGKLWDSFNFQNPWRYFTEMFYYCFNDTYFVVHLQFCGDTGGMCVHFYVIFVFKCCTKLDRLKFINSAVLQSEGPILFFTMQYQICIF